MVTLSCGIVNFGVSTQMAKVKYTISEKKDSLEFPDSHDKSAVKEEATVKPQAEDKDLTAPQLTGTEETQNVDKKDFLSVPMNIFKQLLPRLFASYLDPNLLVSKGKVAHQPQMDGCISNKNTGYVDEEGLLPGEGRERALLSGVIELGENSEKKHSYAFRPLVEQHELLNFALTSQQTALYYQMNDDNTELTATQGANGPIVFSASIDGQTGQYYFSLHTHIDRAPTANIIQNPHFENKQQLYSEAGNEIAIPFWTLENRNDGISLCQTLDTKTNDSYQLSLYYNANQAQDANMSPIDIYWDEEHLIQLSANTHDSHAYTFSVTGHADKQSQLRMIAKNEDVIESLIKNASLESRAQSILPIILGFCALDEAGEQLVGDLTVNVTTTPPLQVNNDIPLDIMFEQSVYQSIVVHDKNTSSNPLTKINLDALFETLTIPTENRQVKVVQLEENGVKTNVYEVMISDKTENQEPITVADVKLSFEGGEGGLAVFLQNINIDGII